MTHHHAIQHDDTRHILKPYIKQRIGFEGVLISTITPNKKNKYTYGLVFASVYAVHQDIELDHVIIRISVSEYKFIERYIDFYKRYYFTAEVGLYRKTAYILGTPALRDHYMLEHINVYKLTLLDQSKLTQPTIYVRSRIESRFKSSMPNKRTPTKEELLNIVYKLPNDGSIEKFIDVYTKTYQKTPRTKHEIKNMLYK